jgi:hypothetical protein
MDENPPSDADAREHRIVRHCPFCGELVGSFWARTDADGGTWCESCQLFFEVTVVDE